ncbi:MAG TPA: serine/threonine-protein phosphatase, partial [Vulgatibacter sp.]
IQDSLQVDVIQDRPRVGDEYLLCSDGLSGMVSDDGMAEILRRGGSEQEKVDALIDAANEAGGVDNVTVVLVRCLGE